MNFITFSCIVIFIQKLTGGQKFIWKPNLDGFVCDLIPLFFSTLDTFAVFVLPTLPQGWH